MGLRVGDWQANDMVLGTGAYKMGINATLFGETRASGCCATAARPPGPSARPTWTAPRRGQAGEPEEEVALGVREPQAPGERLDDLRRRRGRAPLFEPGQVVDRDAGDPGELLATQAHRTTATADRHADDLRRDALAPTADRPAELPVVHPPSLSPRARGVLALRVLRPPGDSLSVRPRAGDH